MSKPVLSGRVLGMKFMARATERKQVQQAEEQHEAEQDMRDAEEGCSDAAPAAMPPVKSEPSTSKRCTVIYENFPQSGAIGRFKFSASSPTEAAAAEESEKKQRKAASKLSAASKAANADTEESEPAVSDADMAKAFMRGPAAYATDDAAAGSQRKKARAR